MYHGTNLDVDDQMIGHHPLLLELEVAQGGVGVAGEGRELKALAHVLERAAFGDDTVPADKLVQRRRRWNLDLLFI